MGTARKNSWLFRLVAAIAFFLVGILVGSSDRVADLGTEAARAGREARRNVLAKVADVGEVDLRTRVFIENPELIPAVADGFGGEFSMEIALNMFGHDHQPAVADARELTRVVEVAPRTWLIRMPIVNAVLFETDEGNVLVDTGMAPAGPAILDKMREVSDQPLHTIIYTHGHVDHAYGTRGILEGGAVPEQILAHAAILPRFKRYFRLRESIAGYMSQKAEQMPRSAADMVLPTEVFEDRLEFELGGETFVLQHHRGETDDQLYVWVPGRRALASADYYQGFLPNAGNGKRVQRYPEEWAAALREMAALEPDVLLPAHGDAITDDEEIREVLSVHANALQSIVDQTIAGLNAGLRQDEIFSAVELPPELRDHPTLQVSYVTPQDISKMVLKRYAGWWNDIPSDWSPAPIPVQAAELASLAGGVEVLASRAEELAPTDLAMAAHLADWAFYADPESPAAQAAVVEVYRQRILEPSTNTVERGIYLERMVDARGRQLADAD